MTEDELQKILETALPAADLHDVLVEECQDQDIRLRFSLKPGETWTSAALLSLVDTSMRAAAGLDAQSPVTGVVAPEPGQHPRQPPEGDGGGERQRGRGHQARRQELAGQGEEVAHGPTRP